MAEVITEGTPSAAMHWLENVQMKVRDFPTSLDGFVLEQILSGDLSGGMWGEITACILSSPSSGKHDTEDRYVGGGG